MNKVLLHNLTIKGIEKFPGILDYDQRGLVLMNQGDSIITRKSIDTNYLSYLKNLGFDFTGCNFFSSNKQDQTYNSIFFEGELNEFLQNKKGQLLSTFQITELEGKFAKKQGLDFLSNYQVAEKYGRKSPFRKICKDLNIPVVQGFEGLSKLSEVIDAIYTLSAKTVLLRLDEGVSGAGNFLLNKNSFLELNQEAQLQKIQDILNKIQQRMVDSFVTVEEWMDSVDSSPSLQIYIHKNGKMIFYLFMIRF